MSLTDDDKQWIRDQLDDGKRWMRDQLDNDKLWVRDQLDDDKRWVREELDKDKLWVREQLQEQAEQLERMETRLLTEFHKWSSPVDARLRSHSSTLRALDLEIESLSDRVKHLEGNRPQ